MKFKIDEELARRLVVLLQEAGYDAMTVLDQKLGGHADLHIASVCRTDDRALITLDMDFADIRTYPPNQYSGVVVLRLCRQDKPHVMATVAALIPLFSTELLERRLWIVYGSLKKTSYGSESEVRKENISSLAPLPDSDLEVGVGRQTVSQPPGKGDA